MALSKDELIEALSNLTILEVTELVSALEEKWGVSAAAVAARSRKRRRRRMGKRRTRRKFEKKQ